MCKQQQPIVDRLSNDPRFANVIRFIIDLDSGKEYRRRLNVAQQGTLIAFKGKAVRARSVVLCAGSGAGSRNTVEPLLEGFLLNRHPALMACQELLALRVVKVGREYWAKWGRAVPAEPVLTMARNDGASAQ